MVSVAPQLSSVPIGSLLRAVSAEKLTGNGGTEGAPRGRGPDPLLNLEFLAPVTVYIINGSNLQMVISTSKKIV